MTSEKFNEVIKSINLMLKNTTLRLDKLEQDSIDEKYNDLVLGFIQKNNKDNWYSIEVTFEYKPVIKNNRILLEIKYSYDNIGEPGCDATPEEIALVKNIIKQIKTNEKQKDLVGSLMTNDERNLAIKRLNESVLTWDRFAEESKGHEKEMIVLKLPEPVKREYTQPGTDEVVKVEFPAISFVKLPNGQELSVFVSFDENNRPMFSVPEEILKMFIEENKLNMYIS